MKIIWVATTGSDTSGDGTRDNPYAGIERALSVFQNSDQIRILDGTYIPTDSIVVSGLDGSIFAENPGAVYIQPERTRLHQACVAVLGASRFLVQGVNILQAADASGNLIGLYVENVETFLAYTCAVSDFEVPSGNAHGIFASGTLGRIERCSVSNLACAGGQLYGIRTMGFDVIDCEVVELSGAGDCQVRGITMEGLRGS
jgi:hypothetical protein